MNFTRNASASWQGSIKEGKGDITTGSGALKKAVYAFGTRFKDENGTNPEELIGAAHAGCYTMQLSGLLGENDYTPDELHTDAQVTFKDGEIVKIALSVSGKVPNIKEDEFVKIAEKAKEVCPVSKLLDTEITLDAKLKV
ncbi:osmotically inducible protein OsmC [Pricia antarctica]|uniref:Osmotically inducible protein OsmC n=1 Tax=Pricia antarctica TaxID=641691 RepID=A0A1G7BX12_9FLAO|nr:OsmC family protein [Pricia antarctica]SDE31583.1 osmotically inducible protein OsmC [Pricia antarctica]